MSKRPKHKEPASCLVRCLLAGAVIALVVIGVLCGLVIYSTPTAAERQAQAAAERSRLAPVVAALEANGCSVETRYGVLRVTLPLQQALALTPLQAKELALEIRSRSGGVVRLLSPAGQQLAEAP